MSSESKETQVRDTTGDAPVEGCSGASSPIEVGTKTPTSTGNLSSGSGSSSSSLSKVNSSLLKNQIVREILRPAYVKDVEDSVVWRFRWRKIAHSLDGIAKFCGGACTVLAFAAAVGTWSALSFASGCCGTLGIVLLQYSSYAHKEAREKTIETNQVLHSLGLPIIPEVDQINAIIEIPVQEEQ
ncbi:MAG: hypothetical protein ACYCOU_03140 [Sulfobacillus sp.]